MSDRTGLNNPKAYSNSKDALYAIYKQHGPSVLLGDLSSHFAQFAPGVSEDISKLVFAVYERGAAKILKDNLNSPPAEKELAAKVAVGHLVKRNVAKGAAEDIIKEFTEALGWHLGRSAPAVQSTSAASPRPQHSKQVARSKTKGTIKKLLIIIIPIVIGGGIGLLLIGVFPVIPIAVRVVLLALVVIVLMFFAVTPGDGKKIDAYLLATSLFFLIILLSLTYLPNIITRPVNIVSNLLVDRPLFGEVFFDNRGFLGTYNRTGTGRLVFVDGAEYVGEFVNGERTGHGTMILANGRTDEGTFINGVRTGMFIITYADGRVDEGNFTDGLRDGMFTITYADGRIEEGNFTAGVRNGRFTTTNPDGTTFYRDWVDGERVE